MKEGGTLYFTTAWSNEIFECKAYKVTPCGDTFAVETMLPKESAKLPYRAENHWRYNYGKFTYDPAADFNIHEDYERIKSVVVHQIKNQIIDKEMEISDLRADLEKYT